MNLNIYFPLLVMVATAWCRFLFKAETLIAFIFQQFAELLKTVIPVTNLF